MNKNIIITAIVLLVIIAGAIIFASKNDDPVVTVTPTAVPSESAMIKESVAPSASSTTTSEPVAMTKTTITYSDTGFSPSSVTIKAGDQVVFVNSSSKDMWPASAMHPTHNVYPEPGGCLGSIFDSCANVEPGKSWSFIFMKVGSWGYHDHLTPKFFGKVIVQ